MTHLDFRPDEDVRTAVSNALRAIVDRTDGVLEDERSRETVAATYRAVTDDERRRDFERALSQTDDGAGPPGTQVALASVVDEVYRRLRDDDVRLRTSHETSVTLRPRDVALYRFSRTRDPTELDALDVSPAVADRLEAGADATANESFDAAREAFRAATDRAETVDEHVVAHVLAGWAAHWAGADDDALPHVTTALERDESAWPARMVGTVADHDSPSSFRDGRLAVRAYLRVQADVPESSTLRTAVRGRDDEWETLSGPLGCLLLPDLETRMDVRLRRAGPLDEFPSLHAYYLAVGVVEPDDADPKNVLHQPLQGPETTASTDTVRFSR